EADLDGDGAGEQVVAADAARDVFGLARQDAAHFGGVGEVDAEGLFVPDAFGLAVGVYGAVVDAAGEAPEVRAVVAEALAEPVLRDGAEFADGADTHAPEALGHLGPDAEDRSHGKGIEHLVHPAGLDDGQAVRLVQI